ncbi:MAG: HlyC/CorC family transporter [Gammaproteobacteria bacterium]|nr:HlyC/CorC family transporter [Gammaproteobacteria bacterium]
MNDISLEVLFALLLFLIGCSAFFSSSETSLLSLNRYRLRHLIKHHHPGAMRAGKLLERPDRLIGIILLGNNFVNILASAIATIIAIRLLGESGVAVATLLLTVVILIFAEVAPKTFAALKPELIAFPSTLLLQPLLKIFYPIVWMINGIVSLLLRPFGVSAADQVSHSLSHDELRSIVNDAGSRISRRYQSMLIGILDLEKATVEEVMVPRNEIVGIDLASSWEEIENGLMDSQHTRLPVYRGDIDNMVGIVHLRNFLALQRKQAVSLEMFTEILDETYYIPEATPLSTQLHNFQKRRQRIALVVDEYGDIQGLVALDDILEEIVGEFTTDPSDSVPDIHPQEDGTLLVDCSISVRDLNRYLKWHLPTDGPKTLNGLIVEYLEMIPDGGTSLLLEGHPIEIVQSTQSSVKMVRINPLLKPHQAAL